MAEDNDFYVEPFGIEWEKEMMKLNKKLIISMFKKQGKEIDALRCKLELSESKNEINTSEPHLPLGAVIRSFPDNVEIWKWWQTQKFQKEQGDQEYTMIYEIDLPKILKAFTEQFQNCV